MQYRLLTANTDEELVSQVQDYLNEISDSPVPLHRHFLLSKSEGVDDTEAWGMYELPIRLAIERRLVGQVYDIQVRLQSEDPEDKKFGKIGQAVLMTERENVPATYYAYVVEPDDKG